MIKGLFAGGLMGVVVGGAGLTVASLVAEQPAGNTPPAAPQVSAPQSAVIEAPALEIPQGTAPTMVAPEVESTASPAVSAPIEAAEPMLADTASAAVPEAADDLADTMTAPDDVAALAVDTPAEEPVLPNPQSIAPQAPVNEQDLTVSTAPAPLPEPVVVAEDAPVAVIPTLDIPVPQPLPADVIVPADVLVIDTPVPEPIIEEQVADAPVTPDVTPDVAQQDVSQDDETPAELDASASTLPKGDSGVRVNRITTDEAAVEVVTAPAVDPDTPALVRYGTAFENTDGKPMIGIVLIDDGSMTGSSAAVASLPFDVTVVIDPSVAGAADRLAAYRAAGIEVGVQSAFPENATPSDVEVALEATFTTLPETVFLLDTGDGGLQNDRAVTEQAMEILAQDGRGLVTVSKGLNTALRAADQAEVPAGVIFRDLDADGQDARVIRRFMDQAAFRARQSSGVLLLARVRPDTISALVLWGTANRAGQVVVAPVSAILTAEQ